MSNHLWQSTLFAVVVALLALALRNNRASVRYWLWFSASVKFFIPFSLLIGLGSSVPATREFTSPIVGTVIEQVAQPFPAAPATVARDWVPVAIVAVWACGFLAVALIRFLGWLRIQAALRASSPLEANAAVEVRSAPGLLEPGVVGWWRPVLLAPVGIAEQLTPRQWEAVLAHEMCHVRRRDNLTAGIHMIVEAIFWFHPLVWWIGARMMEERERACDEEVLRQGGEPQVYAEAILNVCRLYVESPLVCVAGVTGADLKKRIEAIMSNRLVVRLNFAKKAVLVLVGTGVLAAPVVVGILRAQTPARGAAVRKSEGQAASGQDAGYLTGLGVVTASSVTIKSRVDGQLMGVNFKEGDQVQAGQLLARIDPRPYELKLVEAEGELAKDQARLSEVRSAVNASVAPASSIVQLEGSLKTDQAKVDQAKLQLSYTQILSPITGVAGLKQVDPGNIVYASDTTGIVTVNQLQPISVQFSLPEDKVAEIVGKVQSGATLPVEAWSRDASAKIATGRLSGFDNQIDQQTGQLKFKATFDNKDGALFPNRFVVVHLLLH